MQSMMDAMSKLQQCFQDDDAYLKDFLHLTRDHLYYITACGGEHVSNFNDSEGTCAQKFTLAQPDDVYGFVLPARTNCRWAPFLRCPRTECMKKTVTGNGHQMAGIIPQVKSAWESAVDSDFITHQGDFRQRDNRFPTVEACEAPRTFQQDATDTICNEGTNRSESLPCCQSAAVSLESVDMTRPGKPGNQALEVQGLGVWNEQGAEAKNKVLAGQQSEPLVWEVDVTDLKSMRKERPKSSVSRGTRTIFPRDAAKRKGSKNKLFSLPPNLATAETLSQRKVLDLRRWYCMSRPQYQTSCGISSLVSCWNYLFSTLGHGSKLPITQEEALAVLGYQPPFEEIRFGPFTGNCTLMRWFQRLNDHFRVSGRTYFLYKVHGLNKTFGMTSQDALQALKKGLMGNDMTYIYHCQNHYFCPVGFEETPVNPEHAYRVNLTQAEVETWILIGEPSKRQPVIHCKRWEDMNTDLSSHNPDYLDIRRLWRGLQKRKTKKTSGNLHCIMAFQRNQYQPKNFKETRSELTLRSDLGQIMSQMTSSAVDSESDVESLDDVNIYDFYA